jgi:mannan endo-1,4-beta-mannosidase
VRGTGLAVVAAVLAVTAIAGGLWALSSAPAAAPPPAASASRSPTPKPTIRALPRVNKPCQGKIPEPFTGIATNWDFRAHVASFRSYTGAHLRLVEFYNPFPGPFQGAEAQQIVAMHALPLIQLNPRRISMAQVASGGYDSDIRSYAEQVKAFRCHVVLSFGHEMNGWWYPWGRPDTPPRVFKAAWRHFHDVFAAIGVRNVIWSWDPTHQYSQYRPGEVATPASEWYPGNKYVNWIGFDGYIGGGQTFKGIFSYQLRGIRRLTRKPIYLAETGVGDGSHAARQVANLFAGIRRWHLIGLVWFDLNRKNSWTVEGKPAKDAAFRRAIARFP